MRQLDEVVGLTAADVMHRHLTTMPASATVRELRDYFAASASRRLALLVDGARYVGSLVPSAIPEEAGDAVAGEFARREPVVDASEPAEIARDKALAHPSRRVPVVDGTGALVGIVAINRARDGFCGS